MNLYEIENRLISKLLVSLGIFVYFVGLLK